MKMLKIEPVFCNIIPNIILKYVLTGDIEEITLKSKNEIGFNSYNEARKEIMKHGYIEHKRKPIHIRVEEY